MKSELIKLTSKLITYPTTADNPGAIDDCYAYIKQELARYPLIVKEYSHNQHRSVVWLSQDTLAPQIMLNGHIDVVPAPNNMFTLTSDKSKMCGRGVADMKGGIAAFIVALKTLYQSGDKLPSIGLMLTSDEELGGHNRVNYLVNQIGYQPKVVIIPDGGENNHIAKNAKGVLHLAICARGISTHASDLWLGDNAIVKIAKAINNISKMYPVPHKPAWKTTINFGKISGGLQTNQVPDYAEVILDIRYVPSDNPEAIKNIIQNISPECTIKEIIDAQPFKIDTHHPEILKWAKLISSSLPLSKIFVNENGTSDARYFHSDKTAVILSSPIFGGIHADDEWIDINSLINYAKTIYKFILTS